MDNKDFELILKTGESFFVEFKEGVDKNLAKESVAFSNSQGGRIFIGITDNGEIKGIRITNNKIVAFNPGGLVKWLKPEEFGTISKTRNPIIASLLSRTIFVEKLGTGINRIRKAMETSNLPAPEFKFYEYSFYTSLFDKTYLATGNIDIEKIRVKTREKIIDLIKNNPEITTGELAKELGITVKGVEWNIKKLKKEGGIKRVGPAKGGHWEVIE
jgi:ATP-dependent DNA helicase RecG